jgi:hypothetical protein
MESAQIRDDASNAIARYEALVEAYEVVARNIADALTGGRGPTDAETLAAEELRRRLDESRREAWFQAFWDNRPSRTQATATTFRSRANEPLIRRRG